MGARVRVAGSAFLYNEGRFLLARRNPSSRFFGDFFSAVGGSIDEGESPIAAVRREVEEELGIAIDALHPHEPLGVVTTPPFSPIRFETHFFAFPWEDEDAPAPATDELVELRWETPRRWLELWRGRELKIPPPILFFLSEAAELGIGEELWDRCRAETLKLEERSREHEIYFAPGLLMAPLETPTLPPATHTNCYVLGERRGYVVDPAPDDAEEQASLDRLLRAVGFTPEAVVLTHHHHDHAAGAHRFAERWAVPMLAHPLTADRVSGAEAALHDGDVLETDAEPWRVVFTPGHARGHVALFGLESKAVIAGDMISTMSTIIIDPPEGHMGTYLASLDRLSALEPAVLFPSHGPPAWKPQKTLSYFKSHRLEREAKVLAGVGAEGRSLDGIVAAAYDDVDERLWPLAARSALAHLIHLEEAGRVNRLGEDTWTTQA